jgi:hypothetical protein
MSDDIHRFRDPKSVKRAEDLLRHVIGAIGGTLRRSRRLSKARKVDSHRPQPGFSQHRGDVAPHLGSIGEAMQEEHRPTLTLVQDA